MTDSNFTIGFIGLGLIGGSIAKGIRRVFQTIHSLEWMKTRIRSKVHWRMESLIQLLQTAKQILRNATMYFLCAPVQYNVMYLKDLKGSINKNCILTDVGSVKTSIHEEIISLGMEENFIGGHPMAGSEKSGIEGAREDMFKGAHWVLCPDEETSPDDYANLHEALAGRRRARGFLAA